MKKQLLAVLFILTSNVALNAYADNPASQQYSDEKFQAIQKQIDAINAGS